MFHNCTHWKHQKIKFSDFSRAYRNETLTWNFHQSKNLEKVKVERKSKSWNSKYPKSFSFISGVWTIIYWADWPLFSKPKNIQVQTIPANIICLSSIPSGGELILVLHGFQKRENSGKLREFSSNYALINNNSFFNKKYLQR